MNPESAPRGPASAAGLAAGLVLLSLLAIPLGGPLFTEPVAVAQIIGPNPTATLPSSGPPLPTRTPTRPPATATPTNTQQPAVTAPPGGFPFGSGPTGTPTPAVAALVTPTAPLVPPVGFAPTPFSVEVLPGDLRPFRIEMLQPVYLLPSSTEPRPALIRNKESLIRVWVLLEDVPTESRNATVQLTAWRGDQLLPGCGSPTEDVTKSVAGSLATLPDLDEYVGTRLELTFNFHLPGNCNWLDDNLVTIRAHVIGPECT